MKKSKLYTCLGLGLFIMTMTFGVDSVAATSTQTYIGEAKAKTIALENAGFTEAEVDFIYCKRDYDDGIAEYEVDIAAGNSEYDYDINAITGQIISSDHEINSRVPSTPSSGSQNHIGDAKAKSIALESAGISEADVVFMFCKLDYDDGMYEYEVDFVSGITEYDYDINATTGKIIGTDYEINADVPATSEDIGSAKAKSIALQHAGLSESGVSYMQVKLDYDDGMMEYEVDWNVGRTEYEYAINASTGSILEYEIEVDD